MSRHSNHSISVVERAKVAADSATTLQELRLAQAVLLPAVLGATIDQTAEMLGVGHATVSRLQAALGAIEWQALPAGQDCRIVDYLKDFGPRNRPDWERGFRWLKKRTEEFRSVFGPRVRAISAVEQSDS